MPNFLSPPPLRLDLVDGGFQRVTGTTKNTGTPETPVRRRVRLHDQPTGRAVREVWSDATTGAYTFDRIRSGLFYVVGFDHTGQFSGVIETDVTPEPMP
jgi:hypothetical protein